MPGCYTKSSTRKTTSKTIDIGCFFFEIAETQRRLKFKKKKNTGREKDPLEVSKQHLYITPDMEKMPCDNRKTITQSCFIQ